ncbi:MAG: NUDIX domain-containing protein [Patescibacteria group bacterium]
METKTRIGGIIIQDGKLLMLLGKGYKELWTPGGKIDEGESDEECLRRELQEELGVSLVEAKFFKEYIGPSFYNPDKHITKQRIYIIKIEGTITPAMEIESYIWFTKKDFVNKKYPMITMTEKELIPDVIKAGIW